MQRYKGQTCVSKPGGFFCLSVIRFEMCLETVCSRSDVETGAGPSQRAVVHVARRTLRSAIASWRPTHQARHQPRLGLCQAGLRQANTGQGVLWRGMRDEAFMTRRSRRGVRGSASEVEALRAGARLELRSG